MKWALVWLIWIYPRSNKQSLQVAADWVGQDWTCPNQSSSCNQQLQLQPCNCNWIGWDRIEPAPAIGWDRFEPVPAYQVAAICNVYLVHWLYIPVLFELKYTYKYIHQPTNNQNKHLFKLPTTQNVSALIGWNYSIQTGEQIL